MKTRHHETDDDTRKTKLGNLVLRWFLFVRFMVALGVIVFAGLAYFIYVSLLL